MNEDEYLEANAEKMKKDAKAKYKLTDEQIEAADLLSAKLMEKALEFREELIAAFGRDKALDITLSALQFGIGMLELRREDDRRVN